MELLWRMGDVQHILVIEKDLLIRRCLADMAILAGVASVDTADSEVEAIAAADFRRPSVIISGVGLKHGGRGPNAVAMIRTVHGFIPVIFVTADPDDAAGLSDASAILPKPCTAIELAQALEMISKHSRLSNGDERLKDGDVSNVVEVGSYRGYSD